MFKVMCLSRGDHTGFRFVKRVRVFQALERRQREGRG